MATPRFAARIRWELVSAYFGDERAVPADHAESNYRRARESLLGRVPIPEGSVHRIEGERPDLDSAARDYEQVLPVHLDVLLLGLGQDGHTASLFPHSPAFVEETRRVVAVQRPRPQLDRLTITPPVIRAARNVLVLVAGAEKAKVVARAREGPYTPRELPIQLARAGTWLIDDNAAGELRAKETSP
jgi:6-phosphogluconolactonase